MFGFVCPWWGIYHLSNVHERDSCYPAREEGLSESVLRTRIQDLLTRTGVLERVGLRGRGRVATRPTPMFPPAEFQTVRTFKLRFIGYILTRGEQYIMSWLYDLSSRWTSCTTLERRKVISKNWPRRIGNDECDQVLVEFVPLDGTVLPEPCKTLSQAKLTNWSTKGIYQRQQHHHDRILRHFVFVKGPSFQRLLVY